MNKIESVTFSIFAVVGIITIVIGAITYFSLINMSNKVETTGTITKISSYKNYNGNNNKKVKVVYEADGKEYESDINVYVSGWNKGKEIEIYYDRENPKNVRAKAEGWLILIVPGVGSIFAIVGISGLAIKKHKCKISKSLKENGEKIYANYVETVINRSYRVNGISPYNIVCEWNNTMDGKKYIFKSENIWMDPERIINEKNIKTIGVYINRENIKQYVVDIDFLLDNVVDLS